MNNRKHNPPTLVPRSPRRPSTLNCASRPWRRKPYGQKKWWPRLKAEDLALIAPESLQDPLALFRRLVAIESSRLQLPAEIQNFLLARVDGLNPQCIGPDLADHVRSWIDCKIEMGVDSHPSIFRDLPPCDF